MTTFGCDLSHYDGSVTSALVKQMVAEGIQFASHKATEGTNLVDPQLAPWMNALRDGGLQVLSTYHWLKPGVDSYIVSQAHFWLDTLDREVPWWRDFPGWFFQADCEVQESGGRAPIFHEIDLFCDTVTDLSERTVVAYASAGMYGDKLAGLGHFLWNANYGTNQAGPFKAIYPGDNFRGWNAYSGQIPVLLQYSSSGVVAGMTTTDCDAYRGTIQQLLALIGAPSVTSPSAQDIANAVWAYQIPNTENDSDWGTDPAQGQRTKTAANTALYRVRLATMGDAGYPLALAKQVTDLAAQVTTLQASVDQIPTTATPAAPMSDADVTRIANATADILYGRLQS